MFSVCSKDLEIYGVDVVFASIRNSYELTHLSSIDSPIQCF
jgi:hypothetical protein